MGSLGSRGGAGVPQALIVHSSPISPLVDVMPPKRNTLDSIPALTPEREEIARRQQQAGRAPQGRELSGSWLLLALCLLALVGLGAWSYLLHEQLRVASAELTDASARLHQLEQRLLITDESMNQSSDVVQIRLKEMDGEIRKLWDNVWKRAKQQLAEQEKQIDGLQTQLKLLSDKEAKLQESATKNRKSVEALEATVEKNTALADKLGKIGVSIAAQDELIQDLSDAISTLKATAETTGQRLDGTEEWVDSFNGYRTQMNRKILDLQGSIKALQP